MKRDEEIMEILEAFDLTGSYRAAGELAGCDHHFSGVTNPMQPPRTCAPVTLRARRRRAQVQCDGQSGCRLRRAASPGAVRDPDAARAESARIAEEHVTRQAQLSEMDACVSNDRTLAGRLVAGVRSPPGILASLTSAVTSAEVRESERADRPPLRLSMVAALSAQASWMRT